MARLAAFLSALMALVPLAGLAQETPAKKRKVRGLMQPYPGAQPTLVEVEVHPVPVDPPSLSADEADLPEDDLVLGIVVDGQPMAYPIRFLALTEVVDDRVGKTPIAPSW